MAKIDVYQQLLRDIRQGIWLPGQVLTQQSLAEFYQTSRIPVRDALARLLAEGWLIPQGKVGVKVPILSAAQAEELCQIRLRLEPFILELAAPALNFQILGAARDCLLQAEQPGLSALERGELNWQFHQILYRAADKPMFLQLLNQLHQRVAMYLGFQELTLNYQQQSHAEHWQLLSLLQQQDIAGAVQMLHTHIAEAGKLLQHYLAVQHDQS